jgi:hypothetical protein
VTAAELHAAHETYVKSEGLDYAYSAVGNCSATAGACEVDRPKVPAATVERTHGRRLA